MVTTFQKVGAPLTVVRDREAYLVKRFERSDSCWPWRGYVLPNGYGIAELGSFGRMVAHRAVYMLLVGAIPPGLHLDHCCHNNDVQCPGGKTCLHRRCVNPHHLEAVTPRVNALRGKTPGALNIAKAMCPRGHVYDSTDKRGWRKCNTCQEDLRTARRRAAGAKPSLAGASHCGRGHEHNEENTRWSRGQRDCRECVRIAARELAARRRAER